MINNSPYSKLSILIVEDDQSTREVLVSMASLDFKHTYVAKDGCEGLDIFQKYKPDIILTDIQMPCMTGIEMLQHIRKTPTEVLAIFVSAHNDVETLLHAIDLKVDAYVIKPFLYRDILEKIDVNLSSSSVENGIHNELSKREYEVFIDMAKGVKPIDIALRYELKPKTVGTYRKRILEKLHMNSNAELIKYALTYKLI